LCYGGCMSETQTQLPADLPTDFSITMSQVDGENLLRLIDIACKVEGLAVAGFAVHMATKIQEAAEAAKSASEAE